MDQKGGAWIRREWPIFWQVHATSTYEGTPQRRSPGRERQRSWKKSEVGQGADKRAARGRAPELRGPGLKEEPALSRRLLLLPLPSGSPSLPTNPFSAPPPPFADSGFSCYSNRAASPASEPHWRHVHCRIHLSLVPETPHHIPPPP